MTLSRIRRRSLLFLCFLAIFPGNFLNCQANGQTPESPRSSAEDLLDLHLGKGYEALKQEQYDVAEKEFRAALAIDPTLAMRAQFPLAIALFEQHKFPESRHELESVRKAAGDKPGILYYLGRLDLEDQNYKGAIEYLSKAIAHPPYPDTAFYLGMAYLKLDSKEDAEKWLKQAMQVNPGDSRAAYQLATLYRKEGRQEEANQAFQQSKEKRTESDKLSQLRFACKEELDRGITEKAFSLCDQLYDPEDADKLTALGVLYGQHGQLERALKPLQRAAELDPQSPQIQYNLAYTYFQMNRFEEARRSLEGAVQRWPDLFPLHALYGLVLWNLGEIQPAYQALHHAHQLNVQDANTTVALYHSTLQMASLAESASADSEALGYLKEAAELAPAAPEPHHRMAAIYNRIGKPEQASKEEQKASELAKSPRNQQ